MPLPGPAATRDRRAHGGRRSHVGRVAVPDSDALDFRDIEASGAGTAFVLAIGPGDKSRIYKTEDGGKTWALQFTNPDARAFYDAIAFWDAKTGIATGDPVDGRSPSSARSTAAGRGRACPPRRPRSPAGRRRLRGERHVPCRARLAARVVRHRRRGPRTGVPLGRPGPHMAVADTPVTAGNASSGIFSLAFSDADHGIAVGGDYGWSANPATTCDHERWWQDLGVRRPHPPPQSPVGGHVCAGVEGPPADRRRPEERTPRPTAASRGHRSAMTASTHSAPRRGRRRVGGRRRRPHRDAAADAMTIGQLQASSGSRTQEEVNARGIEARHEDAPPDALPDTAGRGPARMAGHASGCRGPYRQLTEIKIGADGGWDYLAVDSAARVSTCRTRRRSSSSTWTRTRSSARSRRRRRARHRHRPRVRQGFVSNGRENSASIVDLKTLQITAA